MREVAAEHAVRFALSIRTWPCAFTSLAVRTNIESTEIQSGVASEMATFNTCIEALADRARVAQDRRAP